MISLVLHAIDHFQLSAAFRYVPYIASLLYQMKMPNIVFLISFITLYNVIHSIVIVKPKHLRFFTITMHNVSNEQQIIERF